MFVIGFVFNIFGIGLFCWVIIVFVVYVLLFFVVFIIGMMMFYSDVGFIGVMFIVMVGGVLMLVFG